MKSVNDLCFIQVEYCSGLQDTAVRTICVIVHGHSTERLQGKCKKRWEWKTETETRKYCACSQVPSCTVDLTTDAALAQVYLPFSAPVLFVRSYLGPPIKVTHSVDCSVAHSLCLYF